MSLFRQALELNCDGQAGGPCNLGASWGKKMPSLPHQGGMGVGDQPGLLFDVVCIWLV